MLAFAAADVVGSLDSCQRMSLSVCFTRILKKSSSSQIDYDLIIDVHVIVYSNFMFPIKNYHVSYIKEVLIYFLVFHLTLHPMLC